MLRRLSAVALHFAAMVDRSPRPDAYWSHFLIFDLPRVSKDTFFLRILSCGLSVRFGLPPILSWVDGNLPGRTDGDVGAGDNEAIDVEYEVLAVELEECAVVGVLAVGLEECAVVEAEILDVLSFLLLSFCDGIFVTT